MGISRFYRVLHPPDQPSRIVDVGLELAEVAAMLLEAPGRIRPVRRLRITAPWFRLSKSVGMSRSCSEAASTPHPRRSPATTPDRRWVGFH
jgi:hypothetical protein